MKVSAATIKALQAEGTEYVFCFPNNPLIDAAAQAGVRPFISRTERTTINMADAYTRVLNGRKIGVCIVQAGPGIENAYGGIAQASADSTPLLVLPGAPARNRLGLPVSYDAPEHYRGISKWTDTIAAPEQLEPKLRRAYTQLRIGRPRPVLLELPADVLTADIDDASFNYQPVIRARSGPDPQDVVEAVRMLITAKCPLLHVGQGVLWAEAWDELREFAELVQAPVMTTTLGKSAFPEDHPLACGHGGVSVTGMAAHFLHKCDLVFAIGSSLSTTLVSCAIPPGKHFVHCTNDERDINAEYQVDHAVLGDAKLTLRGLIAEAKRQLGEGGRSGGADAAKEVQAVKQEYLAEWMPHLISDDEPLDPYRVIWDVAHTVDRSRTIVTHDSGNVRDHVTAFYEAIIPRGYIGWGNSTQLGTSLGVAMGAKLAAPDKLCINFLGDTALGMCGMDLETAARERIPILTLLINNSAMGGYERYMPVAIEKYRSKFLTGDYLKMAEGLGVVGQRVTKPAEIVPALQNAIKITESGHPALVEFITKEVPVWPVL